MAAKVGQAEHLQETARATLAVANLVSRAAEDYGAGSGAGHADSWRLDHDLLHAEQELREIRRRNAAWRQANELALVEAERGDDLP